MSKSERRIVNNKRRRMQEQRRNIFVTFFTLCLVVILSVTAGSFLSKAQSETEEVQYKYYKSVMVNCGDTLWSIASDNMLSRYGTTDSLVQELMQLNGLSDDRITAGSYLIIPYFTSEYVS